MKKALTLASLAALAAGVITTAAVAATSDTGANAEAPLLLADGTDIGTADFRDQDGAIEVHVSLQVPAAATRLAPSTASTSTPTTTRPTATAAKPIRQPSRQSGSCRPMDT